MTREEILSRFEVWLDGALASEEPPPDIDQEILRAVMADRQESGSESDRSCDSYALWAAMTALTQEVKLQGRTFRELSETVGAQAGRIAEEVRAAYQERERDLQRETERRCRKEALGILIDLRDRMERGLESARLAEGQLRAGAGAGWLARLFARRAENSAPETVAALIKGYELALEHLDQAIEDASAHEIRCQGLLFDPRRMNAVDKEESTTVPEGTVLEVYRRGYDWNGEVFRPAQVKVAGRPAADKQNE
jgi:molecular chaperone GrpE (heat shock protein)